MRQLVVGIMIAIHTMLYWAMIVMCGISIALTYLIVDSPWHWAMLTCIGSWVFTTLLCLASVGAEQLYEDYKEYCKGQDEASAQGLAEIAYSIWECDCND